MFWRNPSAAFFNIALPLLFLALFGAIFAATRSRPRRDRPGHRRHERDVDDVHRARPQPGLPARAGRAEADARHAAAVRGLPRRDRRQRGDERGRAGGGDHRRRAASSSASAWPTEWLALLVFLALGVVCFAVAGRRALARDPERGVRARLRQRGVPAGDLHLGRLLRRRPRAGVAARHRPGAAADAPDRRAVRRDGPPRGAVGPPGRALRARRLGGGGRGAGRPRVLLGGAPRPAAPPNTRLEGGSSNPSRRAPRSRRPRSG